MNPRHALTMRATIALTLLLGLAACGGTDPTSGDSPNDGAPGEDGQASLIDLESIPPGEQCEQGGLSIRAAIDADGDGALSDAELEGATAILRCNPPTAEPCEGEPLTIIDLNRPDQSWEVGVLSAPISVEVSATDAATLSVVGTGFDVDLDPDALSFRLTPRTAGGPFALTVIASDDCAIDARAFTVDQVIRPTPQI